MFHQEKLITVLPPEAATWASFFYHRVCNNRWIPLKDVHLRATAFIAQNRILHDFTWSDRCASPPLRHNYAQNWVISYAASRFIENQFSEKRRRKKWDSVSVEPASESRFLIKISNRSCFSSPPMCASLTPREHPFLRHGGVLGRWFDWIGRRSHFWSRGLLKSCTFKDTQGCYAPDFV